MSSKLKRKRQAQRLMRELQESNDARARTISSLRHTTNNLGAEREANKKLAAMNSEQRDTTAYEFHDKDGDELTITFTGGELMELVVYSSTGCMVLEKEGALELANAILQEFGEPVTGGEDG